jgi:hypothetical protein
MQWIEGGFASPAAPQGLGGWAREIARHAAITHPDLPPAPPRPQERLKQDIKQSGASMAVLPFAVASLQQGASSTAEIYWGLAKAVDVSRPPALPSPTQQAPAAPTCMPGRTQGVQHPGAWGAQAAI